MSEGRYFMVCGLLWLILCKVQEPNTFGSWAALVLAFVSAIAVLIHEVRDIRSKRAERAK